MPTKYKVLWIEDQGRSDLPDMAAPVYMSGQYDLTIVGDVSAAVSHLLAGRFDAIIVDIRIPPGRDPAWIGLYQKASNGRMPPRLGLKLLNTILGAADADIPLANRPEWITCNRIAILTVESWHEVQADLSRLGIPASHYRQKRADLPETILLDLISQVMRDVKPQERL